MTEHPYYTSDNTEGQANSLSCLTESDGQRAVVLSRTLFYPQGGGQPMDAGRIDDKWVGTVPTCGDDVVHIVVKPLLPGIVNLRVDATLCQLHARLYSAGHFIGPAGTASGWLPVKMHYQPNEGRIIFATDENGTLPDTLLLQEKIDAQRANNLTKQMTFTDGLWQVGFGHLLAYPCGGMHATHLSEIGLIAITQVRTRKGQIIINCMLVP